VIRAVVRKGKRVYEDEIFGFKDGFRGLEHNDWIPLDVADLRGTLPVGGTILGTSRDNPFSSEGGLERVFETVAKERLDGLIAIGGEGSLSCALELSRAGLPVVGIPKTIDNDIDLTERTFGFDTAVSIATDAIDRLHTTAESHNRVMVVEVMGRHVGHIATWAGIAGGATMTLVPEKPFDIDEVCAALLRRHQRGRFASIIVVAEGAKPVADTLDLPPEAYDDYGHVRLGGIANIVAEAIEARTDMETRVTILGHVQRGGTPTAFDRVLSSRFGIAALDCAHDGAWEHMVALQSSSIVRVPLVDAVAELKPISDELWNVAKAFFP
jgi:6-phosphofructokinase 1